MLACIGEQSWPCHTIINIKIIRNLVQLVYTIWKDCSHLEYYSNLGTFDVAFVVLLTANPILIYSQRRKGQWYFRNNGHQLSYFHRRLQFLPLVNNSSITITAKMFNLELQVFGHRKLCQIQSISFFTDIPNISILE